MTSKVVYRNAKRFLLKREVFSKFTRNSSVWSPDLICDSPFNNIDIPNITVTEFIWKDLNKWADKTAAICGISGRSYTYHQLHNLSRNFASRLRNHFRLQDHDVVCIMLPNFPEYPIVVLGSLQAGAVVTTVNPVYTAHEVSRQLISSNSKIIVTTPEYVPLIKNALKLAKFVVPVICVQKSGENLPAGTISLKELIDGKLIDTSSLNHVNIKADDVCLLPYSSGTTGLSKGVEITNKNIVANCMQQDEEKIRHYRETTKSHQDSTVVVLPLFHIYGLSVLMFHKLSVGSKLVTVPKFQTNNFLSVLEKHKITLFYGAPPIVLFLGTHPEVKPHHLETVDMFMSGAAPLPLADVEKLMDKVQHKFDFLQGYGLTETSPIVTLMTRNANKYESVGYALPNTKLCIVDTDTRRLGPNQVGELWVQGPQVMKGYRNNVEATNDAITNDGWFKTGDLATITESGSLVIQDRIKELIKVKGFQVPPAELEAILKEHTKIQDAAVVGAPDQRLGEVPKAFVVLKEGQRLEEKEIVDFVKEKVADYKRIKEVVFLSAIPKNPSGKILRRVLKEKYC